MNLGVFSQKFAIWLYLQLGTKEYCLFIEFHLKVSVVLNIFVGERSLEPLPLLVASDLKDILTILKFIFTT